VSEVHRPDVTLLLSLFDVEAWLAPHVDTALHGYSDALAFKFHRDPVTGRAGFLYKPNEMFEEWLGEGKSGNGSMLHLLKQGSRPAGQPPHLPFTVASHLDEIKRGLRATMPHLDDVNREWVNKFLETGDLGITWLSPADGALGQAGTVTVGARSIPVRVGVDR
jgi:hypothetical protein